MEQFMNLNTGKIVYLQGNNGSANVPMSGETPGGIRKWDSEKEFPCKYIILIII